mmetsp:Transcript_15773/g.37774  ORF Transcript_15773/g.37774 Transcript_15773/m.37774 type:complete len:322 (-) Transcript_15773:1635-2600(-)
MLRRGTQRKHRLPQRQLPCRHCPPYPRPGNDPRRPHHFLLLLFPPCTAPQRHLRLGHRPPHHRRRHLFAQRRPRPLVPRFPRSHRLAHASLRPRSPRLHAPLRASLHRAPSVHHPLRSRRPWLLAGLRLLYRPLICRFSHLHQLSPSPLRLRSTVLHPRLPLAFHALPGGPALRPQVSWLLPRRHRPLCRLRHLRPSHSHHFPLSISRLRSLRLHRPSLLASTLRVPPDYPALRPRRRCPCLFALRPRPRCRPRCPRLDHSHQFSQSSARLRSPRLHPPPPLACIHRAPPHCPPLRPRLRWLLALRLRPHCRPRSPCRPYN